MTSTICTLFENNYHYGVAALANSLYIKGYRGNIYAGYRGELPFWAKDSIVDSTIDWPGARILTVKKDFKVYFLPLDTNYHLTNYKPDFMLKLWNGIVQDTSAIFYFDPDIVLNAPWSFFEKWVDAGVALCEDVNSPLQKFHPRRIAWYNEYKKNGIELTFKNSIYANGGFIGVNKREQYFLQRWQQVQEIMAPLIGGLDRSSLTGKALPPEASGPFAPFGKTDQDALNISVEACDVSISYLGQEGMGFKHGSICMYHALGAPKPWNSMYLKNILNGQVPTNADKAYWNSVNTLIISHSNMLKWRKSISILLASFIGRFYKKN
jgi:hypothetical protein